MGLLRRAGDPATLGLYEESGRNAQRTALLLRDLLVDYPERADLGREILLAEQEGDRITHDIIHRLNGGSSGAKRPFAPDDGHALATALDDVVDFAEQTADHMAIYGVEAPMEQATAMGDVLVGAGEQIANALRTLRTGAAIAPHLVEIHRLENEGDRISRDAIASLFANGIDPMVVIRWKDIFAVLERAIDATETCAHIIEGVAIKNA